MYQETAMEVDQGTVGQLEDPTSLPEQRPNSQLTGLPTQHGTEPVPHNVTFDPAAQFTTYDPIQRTMSYDATSQPETYNSLQQIMNPDPNSQSMTFVPTSQHDDCSPNELADQILACSPNDPSSQPVLYNSNDSCSHFITFDSNKTSTPCVAYNPAEAGSQPVVYDSIKPATEHVACGLTEPASQPLTYDPNKSGPVVYDPNKPSNQSIAYNPSVSSSELPSHQPTETLYEPTESASQAVVLDHAVQPMPYDPDSQAMTCDLTDPPDNYQASCLGTGGEYADPTIPDYAAVSHPVPKSHTDYPMVAPDENCTVNLGDKPTLTQSDDSVMPVDGLHTGASQTSEHVTAHTPSSEHCLHPPHTESPLDPPAAYEPSADMPSTSRELDADPRSALEPPPPTFQVTTVSGPSKDIVPNAAPASSIFKTWLMRAFGGESTVDVLPTLSRISGRSDELIQEATRAAEEPSTTVDDSSLEPPKKVEDAVSYVNEIKTTYRTQPRTFSRFLCLLRDFKLSKMGLDNVMREIKELFKENPHLISGFDQFLPPNKRKDKTEVLDGNEISPADAFCLLFYGHHSPTLPLLVPPLPKLVQYGYPDVENSYSTRSRSVWEEDENLNQSFSEIGSESATASDSESEYEQVPMKRGPGRPPKDTSFISSGRGRGRGRGGRGRGRGRGGQRSLGMQAAVKLAKRARKMRIDEGRVKQYALENGVTYEEARKFEINRVFVAKRLQSSNSETAGRTQQDTSNSELSDASNSNYTVVGNSYQRKTRGRRGRGRGRGSAGSRMKHWDDTYDSDGPLSQRERARLKSIEYRKTAHGIEVGRRYNEVRKRRLIEKRAEAYVATNNVSFDEAQKIITEQIEFSSKKRQANLDKKLNAYAKQHDISCEEAKQIHQEKRQHSYVKGKESLIRHNAEKHATIKGRAKAYVQKDGISYDDARQKVLAELKEEQIMKSEKLNVDKRKYRRRKNRSDSDDEVSVQQSKHWKSPSHGSRSQRYLQRRQDVENDIQEAQKITNERRKKKFGFKRHQRGRPPKHPPKKVSGSESEAVDEQLDAGCSTQDEQGPKNVRRPSRIRRASSPKLVGRSTKNQDAQSKKNGKPLNRTQDAEKEAFDSRKTRNAILRRSIFEAVRQHQNNKKQKDCGKEKEALASLSAEPKNQEEVDHAVDGGSEMKTVKVKPIGEHSHRADAPKNEQEAADKNKDRRDGSCKSGKRCSGDDNDCLKKTVDLIDTGLHQSSQSERRIGKKYQRKNKPHSDISTVTKNNNEITENNDHKNESKVSQQASKEESCLTNDLKSRQSHSVISNHHLIRNKDNKKAQETCTKPLKKKQYTVKQCGQTQTRSFYRKAMTIERLKAKRSVNFKKRRKYESSSESEPEHVQAGRKRYKRSYNRKKAIAESNMQCNETSKAVEPWEPACLPKGSHQSLIEHPAVELNHVSGSAPVAYLVTAPNIRMLTEHQELCATELMGNDIDYKVCVNMNQDNRKKKSKVKTRRRKKHQQQLVIHETLKSDVPYVQMLDSNHPLPNVVSLDEVTVEDFHLQVFDSDNSLYSSLCNHLQGGSHYECFGIVKSNIDLVGKMESDRSSLSSESDLQACHTASAGQLEDELDFADIDAESEISSDEENKDDNADTILSIINKNSDHDYEDGMGGNRDNHNGERCSNSQRNVLSKSGQREGSRGSGNTGEGTTGRQYHTRHTACSHTASTSHVYPATSGGHNASASLPQRQASQPTAVFSGAGEDSGLATGLEVGPPGVVSGCHGGGIVAETLHEAGTGGQTEGSGVGTQPTAGHPHRLERQVGPDHSTSKHHAHTRGTTLPKKPPGPQPRWVPVAKALCANRLSADTQPKCGRLLTGDPGPRDGRTDLGSGGSPVCAGCGSRHSAVWAGKDDTALLSLSVPCGQFELSYVGDCGRMQPDPEHRTTALPARHVWSISRD